jgi:hypothetical protein
MKSVVVYESWFGNTRQVAEAIAGELCWAGEVQLCSVNDPIPPLEQVDLIVVGGPTHVHGLSSSTSRRGALEQQGRPATESRGVRGWLGELPPGNGKRAAAFDTRVDKPAFLVGSAAHGIDRRLRRRGYEPAARPESFFVDGTPGPLKAGELERAAAWARSLTAQPAAQLVASGRK